MSLSSGFRLTSAPVSYLLAFAGLGLLVCAGVLWNSKTVPHEPVSQRGLVRWVFPKRVLTLGSKQFTLPTEVISFDVEVIYPTQIESDHGFEIVLENHMTGVAENDGSPVPASKTEAVSRMLKSSKHDFELDFPGAQVAPTGLNWSSLAVRCPHPRWSYLYFL
jgi:hypothetical protein